MRSSHTYVGWNKKSREITGFVLLILLLILLLGVSVLKGSISIPLSEALAVLTGKSTGETERVILLGMRLPRAIAAVVLGGGLALSGYLLQTFFQNPIAGPFVLGISSGAKFVVAITMVFCLGRGIPMNAFFLIAAAFIGSLVSMGFVLLISTKVKQVSVLVISGVMIGYICSAATDFIVTFAEDSDIVNLHHWSMGSFSGISWDNVVAMTLVILPVLFFVFLMSKPISAYQMGEVHAKNVGVNIFLFRILLVLFSSILSACVTAFAGPISFVGIAVPQLVKRLFQSSKPILIIPACFLGGAVYCLFCDLLARTVFAPTELSISTVTAIFGAPVVIWVMVHKKKKWLE